MGVAFFLFIDYTLISLKEIGAVRLIENRTCL